MGWGRTGDDGEGRGTGRLSHLPRRPPSFPVRGNATAHALEYVPMADESNVLPASRVVRWVAILTDKDPQALDVLRHSSAHVLATAVRQLVPHAKIGFGPSIEDGFYYDFQVATPFTPEDLERIEAKMHEVVKADYPFVREE